MRRPDPEYGESLRGGQPISLHLVRLESIQRDLTGEQGMSNRQERSADARVRWQQMCANPHPHFFGAMVEWSRQRIYAGWHEWTPQVILGT